jgi:hypothetical protein
MIEGKEPLLASTSNHNSPYFPRNSSTSTRQGRLQGNTSEGAWITAKVSNKGKEGEDY